MPCDLCPKKHPPIQPSGNPNAEVVVIGEKPGKYELRSGIPWSGPGGREFDALLSRAGLNRNQVRVTNCLQCYLGGDDEPDTIDRTTLYFCAKSHIPEYYHPGVKVIVPMGRVACSYFGLGEPLDLIHGIPQFNPKLDFPQYLYPVFNPAACLRPGGEEYHWWAIQDWERLGEMLPGLLDYSHYPLEDHYPEPKYRLLTTKDDIAHSLSQPYRPSQPCKPCGPFYLAVDTENDNSQPGNPLWSVQYSVRPGEAYMILVKDRELIEYWRGLVEDMGFVWIYHHLLHDARQLVSAIPPHPAPLPPYAIDTMQVARTANHPLSLKTLARRLCGMRMVEYTELVGKWGQATIEYLVTVIDGQWEEVGLGARQHSINRLAGSILKDLYGGKSRKDRGTGERVVVEVDPVKRWRGIDWDRRQVVEEVMGGIPIASLAEIDLGEAVRYACRDADATMRVWLEELRLGWWEE